MVENVTPDYYAEGNFERIYELTGQGFNNIPMSAVGLYTDDVQDPLKFLPNVNDPVYTFVITGKSDDWMRLTQQAVQHNYPNYLGAIVSEDGTIVYWTRS